MLRKRLVTVLTINNGTLFRTKLFEPDSRYTHHFVDSWSVDEIIMLDVTRAAGADRKPFFDLVTSFAHDCFVPLAVGGGIRTLDDVSRYMAVGGDKVVVNTGAVDRPELITEIAKAYGAQCVVLSIDAKKNEAGDYEVFSAFGARPTGRDPVSVPVSVLGGAGAWKHFVEGFTGGGASAVCTQNIYHFTESSIQNAKKFLAQKGIEVRL